MTYSKLLDPTIHDYDADSTVESDIEHHKYDLIIYGSGNHMHPHVGYDRKGDTTPFFNLVNKYYTPNEIVFLCGSDLHKPCYEQHDTKGYHVFVREL